MLHPRVDGYWLTEIGPFGDVSYSETWAHGPESARWAMAPRTRHHALRPGAAVQVFDGPNQVWSGLLAEPGRDGTFDAAGAWSRGEGVLALDGGPFSTNKPQTAIDWAITYGSVPWARVNAISDAAIGPTSSDLTLTALLDRYSEASGSKIRLNHFGYVEESAAPIAPTWAMLLAEDLWSRSSDDYVTHLNVIYLVSTGPDVLGSFVRTTADSASIAAISGTHYEVLDLSGFGVLSLGTAQAYADSKFTATGPRMVLSESFNLGPGQLRTLGDSPAGWGAVHPGQMFRVWGMPDRSKAAPPFHTDVIIGRTERTESSLVLAPQGLPPRNVRDIQATVSAEIEALKRSA